MRKVRWGLIGPGQIAHTFAADILFTPNAVLHAVASRTETKAKAFAQTHGIANAYGSYDELCADCDIDAIYIATPHTLHSEQTLQCIAAGKSVLCEKPLVVSAAECTPVIQRAAVAPVTVMEGLWTYFLPAIRTAKTWVDDGRIGAVLQINSSFGYRFDYDPLARAYNNAIGGGCLLDMGIYPIALNWLFTGAHPQRIEAVAHYAPNGVEDDVVMLFDYADKVSTLATSFRARLPNATYIVGSQGYIAIPDSFRASECALYQRDERIDYFSDDRVGSGFEYQIQAVSDDILNGRKESAIMPLAHSLALQQQMDRVRDALV